MVSGSVGEDEREDRGGRGRGRGRLPPPLRPLVMFRVKVDVGNLCSDSFYVIFSMSMSFRRPLKERLSVFKFVCVFLCLQGVSRLTPIFCKGWERGEGFNVFI